MKIDLTKLYLSEESQKRSNNLNHGFTLIEVLIALLILTISLMALLKASGESINDTMRIKDKLISEWVMKQGVDMIQLGLIKFQSNQDLSQVTNMLGQKWYWKAHRSKTPIPHMMQITITSSKSKTGPRTHKLIAYGQQ